MGEVESAGDDRGDGAGWVVHGGAEGDDGFGAEAAATKRGRGIGQPGGEGGPKVFVIGDGGVAGRDEFAVGVADGSGGDQLAEPVGGEQGEKSRIGAVSDGERRDKARGVEPGLGLVQAGQSDEGLAMLAEMGAEAEADGFGHERELFFSGNLVVAREDEAVNQGGGYERDGGNQGEASEQLPAERAGRGRGSRGWGLGHGRERSCDFP